jgi:hypothetical protein
MRALRNVRMGAGCGGDVGGHILEMFTHGAKELHSVLPFVARRESRRTAVKKWRPIADCYKYAKRNLMKFTSSLHWSTDGWTFSNLYWGTESIGLAIFFWCNHTWWNLITLKGARFDLYPVTWNTIEDWCNTFATLITATCQKTVWFSALVSYGISHWYLFAMLFGFVLLYLFVFYSAVSPINRCTVSLPKPLDVFDPWPRSSQPLPGSIAFLWGFVCWQFFAQSFGTCPD